jgi:hypothetical protein
MVDRFYRYQLMEYAVAISVQTQRLAATGLLLSLPFICITPAKADDLADLRKDMQAMQRQYQTSLQKMQQDYETKIKAMEHRLKAAESKTAIATTKADDAQKAVIAVQAAPPPVAVTTAPQEASNAPASAGAFNPAIGVVLDGKAMASSHNPNNWRVPGFALGDQGRPPPRGPSIGESEINLQANIDQVLFGNLTVAFENDNSVSIEEAFVQPTALPWGFTAKLGRFFSGIGYLNEQHAHTWDFADAPLPYMTFLNGQYGDDGAQLRWLAPTNQFFEFGVEALRGASFPANGISEALANNHNAGAGAWSAFVHTGDDIGDSASYSTGLSYLGTRSSNRATDPVGGTAGSDQFTGYDHTVVADAVYKWAPNGNFAQTYVKLQSEFFLRKESGAFTALNFPGAAGTPTTKSFNGGLQTGFYAQAIYQFIPFWRVGARYDQVHAPSLGTSFAGTTLDSQNATPRRYSTMVDYTTSEFGRFRLQYNRDQVRTASDNQFILQYTVSLGAHGAHQY